MANSRRADTRPRLKLWVEQDGHIVMSDWRIRFLEAIDRTGSISAAAQDLQIPYRRLWAKLREQEANLGISLVVAQAGGTQGGGASLTPEARDLVQRYHTFRDGLEETIDARFAAAFGDWAPGPAPDQPARD